jgi:copper chaperone CopZ
MTWTRTICILLLLAAANGFSGDDKVAQTITHRITGLCYPDREAELRAVLKDNPKVKIESIDYARAEATFTYIPKEIPIGSLKHTLGTKGFGIKEPLTTAADKLTKIEIAVVGLDCKGCCLATYYAIYKIDGVEQATVNLKEGRIIALIDPAKTKREDLEAALKKANVQLKTQ